MIARATRATARVARTIHGDVENGQLGIVRATLAVALAVQISSWQSFISLPKYLTQARKRVIIARKIVFYV